MLPSLRSVASHSLRHHARSFGTQDQKNKMLAYEVFSTSLSTKNPHVKPQVNTQEASPTTPDSFLKPRASPLKKLEVLPAQDPLLEFFASQLMNYGKRARAEKSTSEILLQIYALTKAPPLPVLRQAVDLAAPAVKIVQHKVGSKVVAKPIPLSERQRTKKAIEWILEESQKRPGHTRAERVARECIRIIQGSSSVLAEKKEKLHQMAMINRGNLPRPY